MTTNPKSVGDDYHVQQARVRKLQQYGRDIGSAGAFYVAVCEQALREAEQAAISGDPARILRAYQAMKEIEA